MRYRLASLFVRASVSLLIVSTAAAQPFSAQITFGYGEDPAESWVGSVRADGARIFMCIR